MNLGSVENDDFYQQLNTAEGAALRVQYLNLVRELGEFSVANLLNQGLSQATELQLFRSACAREGVTVLEFLAQDVLSQTGLDVSAGVAGVYQR